jgi:DEAD/DEAH box helicase domain-containing protein
LVSWELAREGQNLVVVTGTASGKTICYNLPILNDMMQNEDAHSLFIFPTKALAQDQLNELQSLLINLQVFQKTVEEKGPENDYAQDITYDARISEVGNYSIPGASVYDGDTPLRDRQFIRENARIVLTNPDMLHTGILPHHTRWESLFRNLRFVVIDEIHVYRGVFGSHVANVIRRLKRIARYYGSHPQFILTSATIANAQEFAEKLVAEPIRLISEDGSSRGKKNFMIYNPPVVEPSLGLRRSAVAETVRLAGDLYQYNVQSIIFARSRRTVEHILTYLRESISSSTTNPLTNAINQVSQSIRGYRSGYLPKTRREIEEGLREGIVQTVVSTNALELGIDIGQMDASILLGYPGTIASTWQQAGRAGRRNNQSLTVFIASPNPLDQFLAHHPEYFFGRSPEQALINPDNLLILLAHIRCALFELPFEPGEVYGNTTVDEFNEIIDFLEVERTIHKSKGRVYWMAENYPAEKIPLRTASPMRVVLQLLDDRKPTIVGEVDIESAAWMVHPQAVYLHESEVFLVDSLDLDRGIAELSRANIDYYTEPKIDTKVQLVELQDSSKVPGGGKSQGDIVVMTQVKGFTRRRWTTRENLGGGDLDFPPSNLNTAGYWINLSQSAVEDLRESGLWTNDPNRYGPDWDRIREIVRSRDGYRCQVCGAVEERLAHHVHHKQPFRVFLSIEDANQLSNLITLCPTCHRRVEQATRIRSGLAGLAYVLGNLAPLFLMCDSRDLGIFSDPKAEITNGEPAVVIYETIPAGIGFSARLFELHEDLILSASELVSNCGCADGCPSCVGPAGENGIGGKDSAIAIIEVLAGI